MTRPVRARIDLQALQHNFQQARRAAPGSCVMAVVKANAYGHGLIRVARALQEADGFAVARLEEALELREAGIRQPITLLEGFLSAAELAEVDRWGLDVVVHQEAHLALLEHSRLAHALRVWIKVDTGMHRLGFAPERVPQVLDRLEALPRVRYPVGLLSHLACADDLESPVTERQRVLFERLCEGRNGERSLANSAAILRWPATHYEWVRPGIMLYGVSPLLGRVAGELGLRPVMELSTRLIHVSRYRKGDAIGYGGTWRCPEDMPVGVAAIGYGDGYPRHAPTGTPVLLNGERVPLVGRVSMDMITLDLRGQPAARLGDPVTLWGPDLPVEEVAAAAGTIGYELLTGITGRVLMEEA
jgi:alanine racemase